MREIDTIKYTILSCIFGLRQKNISEANARCSGSCSGSDDGMKKALMDKFTDPSNVMYQFLYCEEHQRAFSQNVQACITCLSGVASSNSLRNCRFVSINLVLKETVAQN